MGVIDAQLELMMPTYVLTQLHFFRRSVDGGVLIALPCETYAYCTIYVRVVHLYLWTYVEKLCTNLR